MTMTVNGVSTTTELGSENYETFRVRNGRKTYVRVQYDYRHTDGELFSCVRPSLKECHEARNLWLARRAA